MNKLSRLLVLAITASVFLSAFSQPGVERRFSGKGIITSENAYPLSAFCLPTKDNVNSIRGNCGVPSVCAGLAIGNTFAGTNRIPPFINWREMIWEQCRMYISERYLTDALLKPGEKIDEMVVTSGIKNAVPLSAFCSPTKENDHSIRVDCVELPRADIAIGQTFGVTDLIPASIDRDDLTWKMSVDGHPIGLGAFGISDFVHPDLVLNPSTGRELFNMGRLWNVVLVNPTPGTHTVQGQVQSQDGAETYTWVVNFTVAALSQSTLSQNPRQSDSRYKMHPHRIYR